YLAGQADEIDETNVELLTSASDIEQGKEIYTMQCVVCHGTQGEGGVGPNFADQYWIHGGDIKDLFRTIKYGVPEKGMISWSALLRPSEMQQVASYILTFQGTSPTNPKAPQGELWTPEAPSEAMLQDSVGAQ
ncbi:MAG: cytochrome c, partial [Saprospiraceae bacterium]|nr:cytochrome c [Saprospiraceae bacterium]